MLGMVLLCLASLTQVESRCWGWGLKFPSFELTKITCSKTASRVSTRSGTETAAGKVPLGAGKVSACVAVDVRGLWIFPLIVK